MKYLNKILIEWNNSELNNSDNIINVTGKDLDRIDNFPEEYIYINMPKQIIISVLYSLLQMIIKLI